MPDRLLDLARGRIDSGEPAPDRRRDHVRTNQEGADFQPPGVRPGLARPRPHLREQMLVTLGLWPMPPKTPLNPRSTASSTRRLHDREGRARDLARLHAQRQPLPADAAKSGKVPGMLCPHGHWADGRVNPEVQQRCIRWAKLGCVVFMYDMVGYNDSKPFGHAFLNDRLRRWGLSLADAPDLEQHPGTRLADHPARRRPGADRLHGRIGRRDADVPAHRARRPRSRSPRRS